MTLARFGLLVLALAPACDFGPQYCEGDPTPPSEEPATQQMRVVAQLLPTESKAVDILFVIDDSKSMTDEQEQLGIWSSEMFDVLSASGELPDLHIGVVSSSVQINGLTQCNFTTGMHVGGAVLKDTPYLVDVAGPTGRVRNYSGSLTDTFAKMARVGDAGCGFEQPFKAAQLALSGYITGSKGFLRDDALLLVVFVTDEDDCSSPYDNLFTDFYGDACSELGPMTSYRCFEHGVKCYDGKGMRAFGDRSHCHADDSSPYEQSITAMAKYLQGLKKDPAQVIVAGIYGKPNGITAVPDERITSVTTPRLGNVCGGRGAEGTGATPAVRMNALMAQFGGRASQSSICDSQLAWAMHDVGLVTRGAATRSGCLRGALIDHDESRVGIQPACHVYVRGSAAKGDETRERVPACDHPGDTGCYTLDDDSTCTGTGVAVHLHDVSVGQTLHVVCDVSPDGELTELTPEASD